jgi:hypothetical protein
MTELELRRFMARRALRDIHTWGNALGVKLNEAHTFTPTELQVLKIECDAFEESLEELRTKFVEFIGPEMHTKIELFSHILNCMDWNVK